MKRWSDVGTSRVASISTTVSRYTGKANRRVHEARQTVVTNQFVRDLWPKVVVGVVVALLVGGILAVLASIGRLLLLVGVALFNAVGWLFSGVGSISHGVLTKTRDLLGLQLPLWAVISLVALACAAVLFSAQRASPASTPPKPAPTRRARTRR